MYVYSGCRSQVFIRHINMPTAAQPPGTRSTCSRRRLKNAPPTTVMVPKELKHAQNKTEDKKKQQEAINN